ncbi:hypothetical protein HDV03_003369 [Kappamyces sp. JEL0829]|nr:hypothetical protein HDV03_003369 [Kappamyces sp. JEL0829]KAJ3344759.1 hypothetical protein HDU91_000118 [Kappamyces sp. JEL0680]
MLRSLEIITGSAVEQKISPSCGIDLLVLNSTLAATCSLSLNSFQDPAALIGISNQQYWQLCTPACQSTLATLGKTIGGNDCADQDFGNGLNGTVLHTYFGLVTSVLCIKTSDNNGYCLKEQLPRLVSVIESIKGITSAIGVIFKDRDVLCTDCTKKELEILSPLNLTGISPQVQEGLHILENNFGIICPFGLSTVTAQPFNFVPMSSAPISSATGSATATSAAAPSATVSLDPTSVRASASLPLANLWYLVLALFL